MVEKLSNAEKRAAMAKLKGWKKTRGREAIEKRFVFADFSAAFAWMSRVAMQAEKMDHHPEWDNVYKSVNVVLTTHDAGGLSPLDIKMATFMDKTAGAAGRAK
ncbi:MAG: 4a-hydroxytetrahydrobiopterin dehydratase [PS1 clade bacterium]|uniref:Putative pterin-4-alpha-carbinolamine dehydratase n=1 Tax=PS1 clade bacterium TaxID=2175152 RepID=A0A937HIP7_9PROT|nr:4a-hydroxytetrahydrobiopterin dehydratase [PS1 clade bacterium]